jgi:Cys-rich protein (TIGR01571 family)
MSAPPVAPVAFPYPPAPPGYVPLPRQPPPSLPPIAYTTQPYAIQQAQYVPVHYHHHHGVPPPPPGPPPPPPPPPPGSSAYTTGLLSLCTEPSITLLAVVVPCYVSARALDELEGRDTIDWKWCLLGSLLCCPICGVIEIWITRHRVQKAYGIHESLGKRFLTMFFCSQCALCQDAREVRLREGAKRRAATDALRQAAHRDSSASTSSTTPLLAAPPVAAPTLWKR